MDDDSDSNLNPISDETADGSEINPATQKNDEIDPGEIDLNDIIDKFNIAETDAPHPESGGGVGGDPFNGPQDDDIIFEIKPLGGQNAAGINPGDPLINEDGGEIIFAEPDEDYGAGKPPGAEPSGAMPVVEPNEAIPVMEPSEATPTEDLGSITLIVEPDGAEASKQNPAAKIILLISGYFKRFDRKQAIVIAAVALVFAAFGFLAVKIAVGVLNGDPTEQDYSYKPSAILYNLTDSVLKPAERGKADGAGKPGDSSGGEDGAKILALLYPDRKTADGGRLSNYLYDLAERLSLSETANADSAALEMKQNPGTSGSVQTTSAPDSVQTTSAPGAIQTTNASDSVQTTSAPGAIQTTGAPDSVQSTSKPALTPGPASGAGNAPPSGNTLIPAEGFFPIEVLSFNAKDDALISGRLKLLNNSDFTLENIYFEIWVEYNLAGGAEKKAQHAFVKNAFVAPGEERIISYATIPPLKGETDYALDAVELAAFDSQFGGEPAKIYYDREYSYLEVLAVGSY